MRSPPFVAPEQLRYPERIGVAAAQYSARELHEPDFHVLRRWAERACFVVDVGANIGNSLASIAAVHPAAEILSFEPNPGLWPVLEDSIARIPNPVELRKIGLADADGVVDFYIPVVDGTHIVGEASLSLDHFDDHVVSERLKSYSAHGVFSLIRTEVRVARYDALGIAKAPDLVKIDVEGLEVAVLEGMKGMLSAVQPILLIESDRSGAVDRALSPLGYEPFAYHPGPDVLAPRGGHISLNTFYVHRGRADLASIVGLS
jgi:FkbM family methyltransferase